MRNQNCCGAVKVSLPAISVAASRRVRKSRGEHAVRKHTAANVRQSLRITCRCRFLTSICDCNQTRGAARQERLGGDLTVKLRRPSARDGAPATWARSLGADPIILDQIAIPPHDCGGAMTAACVLEIADSAGKIAGIDVA